MKQLLFLLLFLPAYVMAQYQGNANQKITLGEQTTADGLVWRGLRADTASKIVPFSDTSAYIILDTVEKTLWLYKAGQVPKWQQVGGSTLDTATMLLPYWRSGNFSGVLPVVNGGTNRTTMPNNYILFGDGNGIDTSNQLFWDRTNNRLGVGTNNPIYKLDVQGSSNTVNMRMASNTANDILLYFTGNVTGDINMFQSAVNATGSVSAQFVNANTATGSAFLNVQVPNTSTGDPFLVFTTSGGTNYSFGIDNSDSDKFKFHSAATPSNSAIAIYTLTTDGKFGIQTESPSEVLHVVGNARISAMNGINDIGADANGVLQAATSDMNLKNTIENSPFGLNEILLLNPVTFLYNDENRKIDSDVKEVGFIAQDVFDIIPNAVSSTGTGDLQLDYRAITATLVKAIQEQQALIKTLEQKILILENK